MISHADVAQAIGYVPQAHVPPFPFSVGDVVSMGTPGGIGSARKPPVVLHDGDVVECEIDGIGTLRNPVVLAYG